MFVNVSHHRSVPGNAGFGLAVGNAAAHQLVISASDPNTKVLKNGLKVAGASWLVYAAHNAYLAQVRLGRAKCSTLHYWQCGRGKAADRGRKTAQACRGMPCQPSLAHCVPVCVAMGAGASAQGGYWICIGSRPGGRVVQR